jgi:hypothetical protein
MRPREILDIASSLILIGLCTVLLWQGWGHWTRAQAAPSAPVRVQSGPPYIPMTWGPGPVVDEECGIHPITTIVVCVSRTVPILKPITAELQPPADEPKVVEVPVKKRDIKDSPPPVRKKSRSRDYESRRHKRYWQ